MGNTMGFVVMPDGSINYEDVARSRLGEDCTAEDIEALIPELEEEHGKTAYIAKRVAAYAELNQHALRYEDEQNGTNTLHEAIQAIKAKYPKPE